MLLPQYVFINSKEIGGLDFILQTTPPYLVARALKFESRGDLENYSKKYNLLGSAAICNGYNILICSFGNIDHVTDSPILGHNITPDQINILTLISKFYERERIKGNETRLKKFAC